MDRVPLTPDKESNGVTANPLADPQYKGLNSFMDDMNYHQMAEHFDISYEDRRDTKIAEQLGYLADWAKVQTKSDDKLQHQLALKQLTRNLGLQMTGLLLVKNLYQYARLDQDRRRIEAKMGVLKHE